MELGAPKAMAGARSSGGHGKWSFMAVEGRRLWLGLVFCHGADSRKEQGHADEDVNSNNSL